MADQETCGACGATGSSLCPCTRPPPAPAPQLDSRVTRCRSCKALVLWVLTPRKRMCVDAVPVVGGTVVLDLTTDPPTATVVALPPPGGAYVSHFATCPDAKAWRRAAPAKRAAAPPPAPAQLSLDGPPTSPVAGRSAVGSGVGARGAPRGPQRR